LRHEISIAAVMLAAGVVCGLSTLVRPAGQMVPFAFGFLLLTSRRICWRRKLQWPFLLIVGLSLAVAPWTIRNHRVFDRFCMVSTNGGSTFWGSNNETVATPSSGKWGAWISTNFDTERKKQVLMLPNEVDRDKLEWQFGRQFLRENLDKVPLLIVGKFYRLLTPFPQSANRIWVFAIAAGHIFLLPLALAGMIVGLKDSTRRWWFTPANAQILTLLVTTVIFYGSERFRTAYEPFLAIYAAVAIVALFGHTPRHSDFAACVPLGKMEGGRSND
jgi:4-amino-4-deoxy-L-arabinose transferase-like glycosyltransferase